MTEQMASDTRGDAAAASESHSARLFALRFRPKWSFIECVRELSYGLCLRELQGEELADRVQVVVQETLENAVKYSTGATPEDLQIEVRVEDSDFIVSVTNFADASQLATLRSELARLDAMDPEAAYVDACIRAMENPEASARLGLARTCFEGKVRLALQEEANGSVRLIARGGM